MMSFFFLAVNRQKDVEDILRKHPHKIPVSIPRPCPLRLVLKGDTTAAKLLDWLNSLLVEIVPLHPLST